MEADQNVVGSGEPFVDTGSMRWEFTEPMAYSVSNDAELKYLAAIMVAQKTRAEREIVVTSSPLTVQTFHSGDRSPAAPSKILEAEKRLGVKLPALLCV